MKSNQSGRSMIEMLGVLAIIGVLSVGGIAGYSKAMAKYRSNKVVEQVSMLITNIRTMYAQQQTYINLDNNLAIEMGVVPEDLIVVDGSGKPTNALRNVFGGRVIIVADSVDGEGGEGASLDYNAFSVLFSGLSRDACIAIATSDWGSGSSSGLLGMYIYTTGDSDPNAIPSDAKKITKYTTGKVEGGKATMIPGDETVRVPLRVDQARLACNCTTKSNCSVTWKYY